MISLEAHAKINLSLDVLNKRDDGYHNLRMIMQTVQLHDTISIEKIPSGVEIDCVASYVPNNSSNIACKAAEAMISKYNLNAGVRIKIDKRIPVAAGLAGGSADAAAVIKGINTLFNLGISQNELMETGSTIGADVPYCIMGGTALAEGKGEELTSISLLKDVPILIVKPRIGVSTAWVYKNLNLDKIVDRPNTEALISAIQNRDISFIAQNMRNVLESVTVIKHPIIKKIKKNLLEEGAIGSMMSGSGPSVFGIFDDKNKAISAYNKIKKSKNECILTFTI
ncbi:4-(cytidine 5'-diphospho)-2-C-methyl-D-erythritol kinase [Ruminiclostridium herbifermentans]|uniref:4-diphosphocytidyl-2-C-methyl-D-erythritol kinase n=1 Tax=Ruminiclostridium herbifermentans TaxID=2488810 RepID=A0A4U7JI55_9FIRM|nr:4-(cytidine 5'-diphospho)-2-C-methyl-D-erythritol kinase [Ruminiclostridium herbifermentans]QNU67002.1 4-(cytidine 5'-diphospho)-2-C-methyl-D-erythritol kinase [Ruminiclostridium herbifermentans]